MSSRVVRRKGKPNRGGGRFNKPRGRGSFRGGRGRGRREPWKQSHEEETRGQSQEGETRRQSHSGETRGHSRPSETRGHSRPSETRGHSRASETRRQSKRNEMLSESHRDPMLKLQMSVENQEMVREMLSSLHVGEIKLKPIDGTNEDAKYFYEEEEVDELDHRDDGEYWLTDSNLVVEETVAFDMNAPTDLIRQEQRHTATMMKVAVERLEKYGFDPQRCMKALERTDRDVGQALELLISTCFDIPLCAKSGLEEDEDDDLPDVEEDNWEEINEQRSEEITVLESIYGDSFTEFIANRVWKVKLELEHLSALVNKNVPKSGGSSTQKKTTTQSSTKDKKNAKLCDLYQKGACRFGIKCKYKHALIRDVQKEDPYYKQPKKELELEDSTHPYQVEIRFPVKNKYPLETPIMAFTCLNNSLPLHTCLNITGRLIKEAKELCADGLPAVFSALSVLDDQSTVEDILKQPPLRYSLPEPIITARQAEENAQRQEQLSEQTHFVDCIPKTIIESGPSESYQVENSNASTADDNDKSEEEVQDAQEIMRQKYGRNNTGPSRQIDVNEIRRTNLEIKRRFKNKQRLDSYQDMLDVRRKLPAWGYRSKILSALNHNQVIVISGMTGCGKTTQVPQFILDSTLQAGGDNVCNIVCTQPRRISAIAVAQRVADERVEKCGNTVGYQIRLESCMSNKTRLLFCTTGILLRRLEGDGELKSVTHIIVDEVHERTEESDFLLLILRDMLWEHKDLKLILMSATLNDQLFSEYFGDCPIIHIPGRTFPVEQFFLEDAIEFTKFIVEERSPFARSLHSRRQKNTEYDEVLDGNASGLPPKQKSPDQNLTVQQLFQRYPGYQKSTLKTLAMLDIEKICPDLIESLIEWIVQADHEFPKGGAILVFMPGMQEISSLYESLLLNRVVGGRNKHKFRLIPLHSTLSSEEQQAVFRKPPEGVTKIVLSTNIAETSVTIDDIVYVIDAGRMKEKRYDASKGMESLELTWVSRANALQRKGRAGRVAEGVAFHLFTSNQFDYQFREQPVPEIQRAPLEQIVLQIKTLDVFRGRDVEDVLSCLLEPPSDVNIQSAVERLQYLGALDDDEELTALGYHLSALPVDVRIGKLMLYGAIFRCLDSALTIAATLSFKSPFVSPFDKRDQADKKKLEFAIGNSDHLTMLKAYQGWIDAQKHGGHSAYVYCRENFLSIKTLQMLASMKRQFVELLSDIGFTQEGLTVRGLERFTREGGDGVRETTGLEANSSNDNMRLVAAILVAALYPNVVQVIRPETKFKQTGAGAMHKGTKNEELKFVTKNDGKVSIHPSSVNFQVNYYESPYLVYHEKMKTSKVYVRDCTMVSVYPLLLFGGGNLSIDLHKSNFVLSMDDGWICFMVSTKEVAELIREVRKELDILLGDKIENPDMDLITCPRGSKIIDTIVTLITTQ